ncbi:hypothetical protein PR202_gb10520 [Eleusine coracana subsp. coracana]|uniref:Uncharacterized protein n=1 Tax=Eleusine coracana subsp. coracana TaxID=191504 RepID=A0AAV5EKK5_ELECO|nr:hypothetical protein PR202_gb10520 [Eleusine coracana subsp. coracana]
MDGAESTYRFAEEEDEDEEPAADDMVTGSKRLRRRRVSVRVVVESARMDKKSVISLKIFIGALFSVDGTIGGECKTIPDFDKDYFSYFELRDQLKDIGLKMMTGMSVDGANDGERIQYGATGGMTETASDGHDSAESSDLEIIVEHEIENKLVDSGSKQWQYYLTIAKEGAKAEKVLMNNWYGIGMFHEVKGGPTMNNIAASRARFLANRRK